MARTSTRPHVYVADADCPADHRGERPCWCGLARINKRHETPEQPAEVRTTEARKLGEKSGD